MSGSGAYWKQIWSNRSGILIWERFLLLSQQPAWACVNLSFWPAYLMAAMHSISLTTSKDNGPNVLYFTPSTFCFNLSAPIASTVSRHSPGKIFELISQQRMANILRIIGVCSCGQLLAGGQAQWGCQHKSSVATPIPWPRDGIGHIQPHCHRALRAQPTSDIHLRERSRRIQCTAPFRREKTC